jgi:hypothetical protein
MRRIAGACLKDLRREAVSVSREQVTQRRRLLFCLFEVGNLHSQERAGKLNFGAREGRKSTLANNTADGTFAADECCLDGHAVLKDHKV